MLDWRSAALANLKIQVYRSYAMIRLFPPLATFFTMTIHKATRKHSCGSMATGILWLTSDIPDPSLHSTFHQKRLGNDGIEFT
jgi:hypothetical protein